MTTDWKRWIHIAWLCLISFSGNAATPLIAADGGESLFLNGDGSVWGTGRISGYFPGTTSPGRLLQLSNVVSVAADNGTEFALLADGTLWGVGGNNVGQLGDGTTQYRSQPQRVLGLSAVKAVAAYNASAYALSQDGTVWAWGSNSNGQLGDGTQNDRYMPGQVVGLANITKIAAGGSSALALRADGTVWVWGSTAVGSAGDGSHGDPNDPGYNHLVPTQVHNLDQVIAISAGFLHHLALRSDGTVWTWGWGASGQNGIGTLDNVFLPAQVPGLDHIVAIEARGFQVSLALKADGTLWAWGTNNVGQLGVSGINYSAAPIQVPGLTDIVAIAAGFQHVLAMRRDGTVLAWGGNDSGQLGDNTLQDRPQPLPVAGPGGTGQLNLLQPAPTSFNQLPTAQINQSIASGTAPLTVQFTATNAADPNGTVRAFNWKTSDGQQAIGQSATFVFAQPGTFTIDLLVVDNVGASGWSRATVLVNPPAGVAVNANPRVALTYNNATALTNDGRILTWGQNGFLGRYDTNAAFSLPFANSLPSANGITGAVDIAADGTHVLLPDGSVIGWGPNNHGQVGIGSHAAFIFQPQLLPGLPPVQSLASGFTQNFALTRDGRVFAWGQNVLGQLGLGDNIDRFQPTELTGLTSVVALVSGYLFSAALKTDGTVWAWGDNSYSQLGDGTQTPRNRPSQVPGLTGITKIFPNAWALFAQKSDGTVWATGFLGFNTATNVREPTSGAYRVPDLDNALQIAGGGRHIVALKTDGTIWTGGIDDNTLGSQYGSSFAGLRQVPGISDAISVVTSPFGAMALRRDGTVLAWGLNNLGQIGDGTLAFQQTPVLVVNESGNGFLDLIPEVANTIPGDKIPPFFLATYANGGLSALTLYADVRGITPSGAFAAASSVGPLAAGGYNISPEKIPQFLRASYTSGDLRAPSQSADIRGVTPGGIFASATDFANPLVAALATGSYNVYVAAGVPAGASQVFFQLNSNNIWSTLVWPMAEFIRGVALDSQDAVIRVNILQNVDVSAYIGTSILVGYGTSPDEMLSSARYRTIFTVTQPQ